jgi:hypothetical protein
MSKDHFRKWILQHIDSWFAFTQNLGLGIEMEDTSSLFFSYHHHLVLVLVHTSFATENTPGYLATSAASPNLSLMSTHHPDPHPLGDTGPPNISLTVGPLPNFITVLELFRAQRDSQVLAQAVPPPHHLYRCSMCLLWEMFSPPK